MYLFVRVLNPSYCFAASQVNVMGTFNEIRLRKAYYPNTVWDSAVCTSVRTLLGLVKSWNTYSGTMFYKEHSYSEFPPDLILTKFMYPVS